MKKQKNNLNDILKLNNSEKEEYNENTYRKLIENQHHFCKSFGLFSDIQIEKFLRKISVNFNNISFDMFVYKKNDGVSETIIKQGNWEKKPTNNLLKALEFYSNKKKLPKNEIIILDIGANIGWYSLVLGKFGYELMSFEVSNINTYILKKNYCLNKDINITIINRGIGLEEENCLLHHPTQNIGDAIILCGENTNIPKNMNYIEKIKFTRLSNYIPYLIKRNLALIKLDIEGAEGKAIISGIELITKYHIPFIFVEFVPDYLKMQGTDPKEFLEIFENNEYKISIDNFLSKKYLPINQILKLSDINLYIVYSGFL